MGRRRLKLCRRMRPARKSPDQDGNHDDRQYDPEPGIRSMLRDDVNVGHYSPPRPLMSSLTRMSSDEELTSNSSCRTSASTVSSVVRGSLLTMISSFTTGRFSTTVVSCMTG